MKKVLFFMMCLMGVAMLQPVNAASLFENRSTEVQTAPCDQFTYVAVNLANQSLCSGGTVNALEVQGAGIVGATYNYQWQSKTSGAWADISGATSATYTPSNTVSDSYRCLISTSQCASTLTSTEATITVYQHPGASIATPQTQLCTGGTTTLTATVTDHTSSTYTYAYTWVNPQTQEVVGHGLTYSLPVNLAPATYNYTFTVANAAYGCSTTASAAAITVNAQPKITITANDEVCDNAALSVSGTVTGGCHTSDYTWTLPAGGTATGTSFTQNITTHPVPANDTVFRFSVQNAYGCYAEAYQHVTVKRFLTVTSPLADTVVLDYGACDTAVTLTKPTFTYSTDDAVAITSDIQARYTPGEYTITWTLTDVCGVSRTCTQTLTVLYPPCGSGNDMTLYPVAYRSHIPNGMTVSGGVATTQDYNGNSYNTVRMNCECWTKENLKSTEYYDGYDVPFAKAYYSDLYPDSVANVNRFGRLYDWYSAVRIAEGDNMAVPVKDEFNKVRGVCPRGWYLPTIEQFENINNNYSRNQINSDLYWIQNAGSTTPPSLFEALPAGYYLYSDTSYQNMMGETYYWTCQPMTSIVSLACSIQYGCPQMILTDYNKGNGFSVRCVKSPVIDLTITSSADNVLYICNGNTQTVTFTVKSNTPTALQYYWFLNPQDLESEMNPVSTSATYTRTYSATNTTDVLVVKVANMYNELYSKSFVFNVVADPNPVFTLAADNQTGLVSVHNSPMAFGAPYTYAFSDGTSPVALNDTLFANYFATGDYTVTATDVHGCTSTQGVAVAIPAISACAVHQMNLNEGGTTSALTSVSDLQGNLYTVVPFGTRCFTRQNMRSITSNNVYNQNLVMIPAAATSTPAACFMNNDPATVDLLGAYYNLNAANVICPLGWHLPTSAEMQNIFVTNYSTNLPLSANILWTSTKTNNTLFSALPAGVYANGGFGYLSTLAAFWTNDPSYSTAHALIFSGEQVSISQGNSSMFASVRCVRDEAPALAITSNATDNTVTFCAGKSATVVYTVTPTVAGNYSYTWKVDGVVKQFDYSNTFSYSYKDAASTAHTVTVTVLNDVTGSITTNTVVNALPVVTISENIVYGTATVTAPTSGVTYAWTRLSDNTAAGTGISISYVQEGAYKVVVTNATTGCSATKYASINKIGCSVGSINANETGSGSILRTVSDKDNNSYTVVQIGNQCWMKENVRSTQYSFAVAQTLPFGTSTSTSTRYCYYPNNSSANVATYGLLYNWPAVMFNMADASSANPSGVQGICPTGWHVPSYAEWTTLTDYVGSQSAYRCDGSSTNIAKALASTSGWNNYSATCAVGNTPSSNNATGFGVVPAGFYYGSYYNFSNLAYFWGATESSSSSAYYRFLNFSVPNVNISDNLKSYGSSVRCVRGAARPTVGTVTMGTVQYNNADVNSTVYSDGGAALTAAGFVYSASVSVPAIGTANCYTATVTPNTGSISRNISGLTASTTYHVRAYATNIAGTAYGDDISFTTAANVSPAACPGAATVTDVDGNTYNTLQLGTQCWMKENLKTTKYSDGTSITLGTSSSTAVAYRYNPSDNAANVATYGYLYNWKAVMRNSNSSSANPSGVQGICPTGWHVPSDAEWTQLTTWVSSQSAYQCGGSSTNIAKALASTSGWTSSTETCAPGNDPSSNNETGFGVVPAGGYFGVYDFFGTNAFFWSATQFKSSFAYRRYLYYNHAAVASNNYDKATGFSVRCLRD